MTPSFMLVMLPDEPPDECSFSTTTVFVTRSIVIKNGPVLPGQLSENRLGRDVSDQLLRLIECGKHRSASNSNTGVVHCKYSQLSGRQSRPGHHIALAIVGKKDASTGAPQAEIQLFVGRRDDFTRYDVSSGALKHEVTFFDIKGHEIRLRLAEVLAIAAD
ncbi:hypothetical protein [Bradyrhizobium jicamae]|uniref:hypothetical protein n=1 Tax=Bradyrhizobium jicamae TaxID=280332 RepID=UPI0012EE8E5D|nr:hypothetical protein [Bradyrhizobium jicamae]